MNAKEIPDLNSDVQLVGFNTNHGYDSNLAPDGTQGFRASPPLPWSKRQITVWTKDKVMHHLREIAERIDQGE